MKNHTVTLGESNGASPHGPISETNTAQDHTIAGPGLSLADDNLGHAGLCNDNGVTGDAARGRSHVTQQLGPRSKAAPDGAMAQNDRGTWKY